MLIVRELFSEPSPLYRSVRFYATAGGFLNHDFWTSQAMQSGSGLDDCARVQGFLLLLSVYKHALSLSPPPSLRLRKAILNSFLESGTGRP